MEDPHLLTDSSSKKGCCLLGAWIPGIVERLAKLVQPSGYYSFRSSTWAPTIQLGRTVKYQAWIPWLWKPWWRDKWWSLQSHQLARRGWESDRSCRSTTSCVLMLVTGVLFLWPQNPHCESRTAWKRWDPPDFGGQKLSANRLANLVRTVLNKKQQRRENTAKHQVTK